MIDVGFVTDIGELMRRRRHGRMTVRREAWAELTTAIAAMADVIVRDAAGLLATTRRGSAGLSGPCRP